MAFLNFEGILIETFSFFYFMFLALIFSCFSTESKIKYIIDGNRIQIEGKGETNRADLTQSAKEAGFLLSSIAKVTIGKNIERIGTKTFECFDSLKIIQFDGTKSNLASIGVKSFQFCTKMESFTVPEGTTEIGAYSFYNCICLVRINFNSMGNLISIGEGAFQACKQLDEFYSPHSLESVGNDAFADCSSLKHVFMQENIKRIGKSCFANDINIDIFYYSGSNCFNDKSIFYGCSKLKEITVWPNFKHFDFAGLPLNVVSEENSTSTIDGDVPKEALVIIAIVVAALFLILGIVVFVVCYREKRQKLISTQLNSVPLVN